MLPVLMYCLTILEDVFDVICGVIYAYFVSPFWLKLWLLSNATQIPYYYG